MYYLGYRNIQRSGNVHNYNNGSYSGKSELEWPLALEIRMISVGIRWSVKEQCTFAQCGKAQLMPNLDTSHRRENSRYSVSSRQSKQTIWTKNPKFSQMNNTQINTQLIAKCVLFLKLFRESFLHFYHEKKSTAAQFIYFCLLSLFSFSLLIYKTTQSFFLTFSLSFLLRIQCDQ